jgi:hypothetical protein
MTYADAAATMRDVFARWRSSYGSRLAQAIVYQHADLRAPGRSSNREHYFGLLTSGGKEKGDYTSTVRRLISEAGP